MDPAHRETEIMLKKLEARISSEYKQAADEVQAILDDYLRRYAIKDKKWREWVASGYKTKEQYKEWKLGQIAMGRRWEAVRDQCVNVYRNADKAALDMSLGMVPEVFALNFNYATYEIEHGLGIDTSFTLYNREAVMRLIAEDPKVCHKPGKRVSQEIAEGKAKEWNRKQVQSVMVQAILQGESIPKIATRLAKAVGDSDRKAAIRNARTMTTGAQNAGRVNGYKRAQAMGIELSQQWVAVLDFRTRHSHRLLDGEVVDVDAEFSNGCRYPGDPDGDPREIYNCFVGDTCVAADCDVKRVYRHKYNGELITVKCASGVNFTCTPNHPILTMRGWIPAKLLNNGDNLVVTFVGDIQGSRWNPNINHAFARFDTAHKFIDMPCRKRVSTLSVNFHGDIPTSDVEVVTEERFLRSDRNACKLENKSELRFEDSDTPFMRGGSFRKHFWRIWKAAFGFVSRLCDSFSFLRWRLRHPEVHGLRSIALLDSNGVKPLDDYVTRDVEFLGECLDGFSGVVFADNVIDVNINSGSTHVYNLQSENGYYFVNGSIPKTKGKGNGIGVIAHNCRCGLKADIKGFEDDLSDLSIRRAEKLEGMSYNEWKNSKREESNPITLPEEKAAAIKASYIREYMYGG